MTTPAQATRWTEVGDRVFVRRYRFYDVYRMRVRQFERHYFGQLFTGASVQDEPWLKVLKEKM